MASTRESFRLDGLIEKCRLLLTKNTINNNADLKNKVDNLILEIDKSIKIINRAEIEIKIANEDQYFKWTRNEEQKSRFTTLKENEIRQILEDLNNRYIEINNEYQEIKRSKSIPFHKKIYNRFLGHPPALNVPYSSANTGPVLATPIIND